MDLSELTALELLQLQAEAVEELRLRKVVRTANNPIGDYTEWLVSTALGFELVKNSAAGYDAVAPDGVRVQIKGRRVTARNPSRQLSVVRKLEAHDFDELVAVIFNEVFEIIEAVSIPYELVGKYGHYRKHVNGYILHVSGNLLEDSGVKRLRNKLAAASDSLQARSR